MRIDAVKVKQILIEKDMKQTDLVRRSGLAYPTINGICCGRSCKAETAQRIADALQLPVADITAK